MFENHVLQEFKLPNGSTVLEQLYDFPLVKNSRVLLTEGSAATGFDCGVPPEPSVRMISGVAKGGPGWAHTCPILSAYNA